MEKITSLQNTGIKNVVKLVQKAAERKAQKRIVVEGLREIKQAVDSGFQCEKLFICPDFIGSPQKIETIQSYFNHCYETTPEVFKKMAYRETSDGLLAVFVPIEKKLKDITFCSNPLVIILESVEKPGNLGAILRTAEAAHVDALICCDPLTDFYNPNVIRSSLGCVFTVPVVSCTTDEAIQWLKTNKIASYAAALNADKIYSHSDFKKPCAFIMGTEAYGLSQKWLDNADEKIIIPMLGKHDSLNVSVATAILVYEALRQRNFQEL